MALTWAVARAIAARRHAARARLLAAALIAAVPGVDATPIGVDAPPRERAPSAGAAGQESHAASVEAVERMLRAGDFETAEATALALSEAAPDDADRQLLLALTRVGGERLGALQTQIRALDARSVGIADRLRTVVARRFLSQGRRFLARYFVRDARTPGGQDERLRIEAEASAEIGDVAAAKAARLALLKRHPRDADAMVDMARLHLLEQRPERALSYLARADALGAGSGKTRLVWASAHMLSGALGAADSAYAALEARGAVAQLVAFNRALIAYLRGDPASALAAFRALPARPGSGLDPVPGAVLAALAIGDAGAARTSLDGSPEHRADPLYALLAASLAASVGDDAALAGALSRASPLFVDLALHGDDALRYLGAQRAAAAADVALRSYLYRLGYFRLAAQHPIAGDGVPPPLSLLSKARGYWKAGMNAEALEAYAALRRAYPELLAPLLETADVRQFRGETEAAIRLYRQAVQLHPGLVRLQLQLGDLLATSGQIDDALSTYRAVAGRAGGSADAEARIASVLLEQHARPRDALPHAERAHRARPGDWRLAALLGRVYRALGDNGQAFTLLRDALERSHGRDREVLAELGHVLLALGRREEARRAFERALDAGIGRDDEGAAERAFLALTGLDRAG